MHVKSGCLSDENVSTALLLCSIQHQVNVIVVVNMFAIYPLCLVSILQVVVHPAAELAQFLLQIQLQMGDNSAVSTLESRYPLFTLEIT